MKENRTFTEARLDVYYFDATDIVTASVPIVEEDGDIVLPPMPLPDKP